MLNVLGTALANVLIDAAKALCMALLIFGSGIWVAAGFVLALCLVVIGFGLFVVSIEDFVCAYASRAEGEYMLFRRILLTMVIASCLLAYFWFFAYSLGLYFLNSQVPIGAYIVISAMAWMFLTRVDVEWQKS